MSIFSKQVDQITYEDVRKFCEEEMKEGISLDYKENFSSSNNTKLAKTVCSFANAYGGTIVIGVKEQDSKPRAPFQGIKYNDHLEEKVWSIIIDNIYPPVSPAIRVCPPVDKKTFIIIRVEQSDRVPHAIHNNTQAYIRTGNITRLEDLASINKIEWLLDKRKKSEEFREELLKAALVRYQNVARELRLEKDQLEISVIPLYPKEKLLKLDDIKSTIQASTVRDRSGYSFPQTGADFHTAKDAVQYFGHNKNNNYTNYTEINLFGMIYFNEDIVWENKKEQTRDIPLQRILARLDIGLEAIASFYKNCNFAGLIKFKFNLKGVLDTFLQPLVPRGYHFFPSDRTINKAEDNLTWEGIFSYSDIQDASWRKEYVTNLILEIAWALRSHTTREIIEKIFTDRGR